MRDDVVVHSMAPLLLVTAAAAFLPLLRPQRQRQQPKRCVQLLLPPYNQVSTNDYYVEGRAR